MSRKGGFCVAAATLVVGVAWAGSAAADSITPNSFTTTLDAGESVTIDKTVTVTSAATTSQVDIFFLADTTGSMGGAIASVSSAASGLLSSTAAFGDVQWGVGEYKDVGDSFVYRLNQQFTSSQPAVQTGIDQWLASGGGDFPEANFFGLLQASQENWRTGSTKILVWFGDAPSHDPANGVSETQATDALVDEGIRVEAINVGTDNTGIDQGDQATRITDATGGTLINGVNQSEVADAIADAITTAVNTYSSVCLDTSEAPAGIDASASACHTGSFDRSINRTFDFTLTLSALADGTYSFNTYATVDGGRVATEADQLTVGAGGPGGPGTVQLPGTVMLLGAGLLSAAWFGSRRRR